MTPTFVVQLPSHLVEAYQAGKIIITGGVARDAVTKQIVAHLEQVSPQLAARVGINLLGAVPLSGALPLSAAFVATDLVEGVVQGAVMYKKLNEITTRVNEIYSLVTQLQFLAWMNTAMLSLNLGLNLVGFCKISSQINQLSQKLDRISSQLYSLLSNEQRKLLKETRNHIKTSGTLSEKLEQTGLTDVLEIESLKLLDVLETHLEDLISRYKNGEFIKVRLEYIHTAYLGHANLLRAYFTAQHLKQQKFFQIPERISALEQLKKELISREILELLYEECTFNPERLLTEREIKDITFFYKASCKESFERVNSHFEILSQNGIEELDGWKREIRKASDPVVFISH